MFGPGPVGVSDLSRNLLVGQTGFLEVDDSSVSFGGVRGKLLDVASVALRAVLLVGGRLEEGALPFGVGAAHRLGCVPGVEHPPAGEFEVVG